MFKCVCARLSTERNTCVHCGYFCFYSLAAATDYIYRAEEKRGIKMKSIHSLNEVLRNDEVVWERT